MNEHEKAKAIQAVADARHVDEMLGSMEGNFLTVLAEHQHEQLAKTGSDFEGSVGQRVAQGKALGTNGPDSGGCDGPGAPSGGGQEIYPEDLSEEARQEAIARSQENLELWVRISRPRLDQMVQAMFHTLHHNCEEGQGLLLELAMRMVHDMTAAAVRRGWYDEQLLNTTAEEMFSDNDDEDEEL